MRCEIVAVGTELLLGQTVDTNSAWLAERLAAHGIDCHFHTTVGDNVERIASVLRAALARNDAVVVCGGLGPTQDDVTRQAVAEVAGVPLERDEEVLARIRRMFEDRGREMAPSNARQADVPRGAVVIPQTRGTAPGLVVEVGGRALYA
ncbi:MAG: competence/damage-inducible protein A, partial [Acidimicrobiales bacterium]